MNIVSKQDYWTTILNDLSQFGQISTEDPKFNEIADYVWRVLQNTLILTEDEKQIKHWEEIVNVSGEGLTQFQRKVNLLFLLSEKSYIPMNLLRKALDRLLGEGEYDLVVDDENDTVTLYYSKIDLKEKANFILEKTIPSYYSKIIYKTLPTTYLTAEFLEAQSAYVQVPFSFDLSTDKVRIEMATSIFPATGAQNEGYIDKTSNNFAIGQWYSKISVTLGQGIGRESSNLIDGAFYEFWCLFNKDGYSFGEDETVWNSLSGNYKNIVPHYNLFSATASTNTIWKTKRKWWKAFKNGELLFDLIPAITPQGEPVFYNNVDGAVYTKTGSGYLIVGMNMAQACNLYKLPAGGGTLTVSLPWEAQLVQHNAEVEAALQAAKSNGWTITVQYREPEADSELYNKYAACVTLKDMSAVNADYKNDLTADGEWIYPLPELTNANYLFQDALSLKKINIQFPKVISAAGMFERTGLTEVIVTLPAATSTQSFIKGNNLTKVEVTLPVCTSGQSILQGLQIEEVYMDIPSMKSMLYGLLGSKIKRIISPHTILPLTTNTDIFASSNFEEWPWELPNLQKGQYLFHTCRLDKVSTLRVLRSIPEWTDGVEHKLTMGIHVDHQSDEEVLTAISNAEAKGWTMTVQWNGTPTATTASTYGLRKPTIYAKLGETVDINGETKPSLDWGHYVTNAEENGYQEFSSIEEANEYFNIESETEQ